jgi:Protein of unknown function (DUF1553)/Protein of unknown function (DUF1549)/Bacterial Ig-like domain (group 2)
MQLQLKKTFNLASTSALSMLLVSAGLGTGAVANDLPAASSVSATNSTEPPTIAVEKLAFETLEPTILLRGSDARWQLQLTAITPNKQPYDVTRFSSLKIEPAELASIDASGFITPHANGKGKVTGSFKNGVPAELPIEVAGMEAIEPVSFPNQVVPIFTKLGCNSGGCHGKAAGQNGFKLSLLGFEPREDFEHLVNEGRGRRLFPAVPDQSLLLAKAINASPHGGGQRLQQDSHEYRLMLRWIAQGMPYGNDTDAVVSKIEVTPNQRTLTRNSSQQIAVVAEYSNGKREDITRTVQFESNNSDLATVSGHGLVSLTDKAGDAAIMARYQGKVGVFRVSVPLGADVESWPEKRNLVDEHVFAKLQSLGIPASEQCDDSTFIRRATLDIAGRLPSLEETQQFLSDASENKYVAVVDRLLESPDYADFFAKKWTAILRNKRSGQAELFNSFAFHDWLRNGFYDNKPYDQLVRELLTASGSVETNPAVVWYREVASTESRVEDAAQLFLGQRIQCARCHHHPFEKWSQADYFHMSAFFTKLTIKEGSTPEQPMFVSRLGNASAQHPKSGQSLQPAGLDGAKLEVTAIDDPRNNLVDWMVAPENPFFARSLTNRYWKHFFERGLVEPEDDLRVTNPPANPELLDGLAKHFADSKYDLKGLIRLICTSTTYRLSSEANEQNLADQSSYSRYYPKRLQAEVLLDAIDQVVGSTTAFEGMPAGTRAVSLPDTSFNSYFLTVFGRPDSASACECERSQEATLAQSLHLLNSSDVQAKLANEAANPARLAKDTSVDHPTHLRELYLRAFSRQPTAEELQTALSYIERKKANLREAYEDLVWALINSKEFVFNH